MQGRIKSHYRGRNTENYYRGPAPSRPNCDYRIVNTWPPSYRPMRRFVPSSQLTKRNEAARRFVPEREAYACKTLTQSDSTEACQSGVPAKNKRQPIKRNSGAEVMYVMNANVCGEPAQSGRQVVVRAAVKCRRGEAPIPLSGPARVLEPGHRPCLRLDATGAARGVRGVPTPWRPFGPHLDGDASDADLDARVVQGRQGLRPVGRGRRM